MRRSFTGRIRLWWGFQLLFSFFAVIFAYFCKSPGCPYIYIYIYIIHVLRSRDWIKVKKGKSWMIGLRPAFSRRIESACARKPQLQLTKSSYGNLYPYTNNTYYARLYTRTISMLHSSDWTQKASTSSATTAIAFTSSPQILKTVVYRGKINPIRNTARMKTFSNTLGPSI